MGRGDCGDLGVELRVRASSPEPVGGDARVGPGRAALEGEYAPDEVLFEHRCGLFLERLPSPSRGQQANAVEDLRLRDAGSENHRRWLLTQPTPAWRLASSPLTGSGRYSGARRLP